MPASIRQRAGSTGGASGGVQPSAKSSSSAASVKVATASAVSQPGAKQDPALAPTNRNTYEQIADASSKPTAAGGGAGGGGGGGGAAASVVNKNLYEMVDVLDPDKKAMPAGAGAGAGAAHPPATTSTFGGPPPLTSTITTTLFGSISEESRSSNRSRRQGQRRRRRLRTKEEIMLERATRAVVIGCGLLLSLIIIGAAAGAGIYLITESDSQVVHQFLSEISIADNLHNDMCTNLLLVGNKSVTRGCVFHRSIWYPNKPGADCHTLLCEFKYYQTDDGIVHEASGNPVEVTDKKVVFCRVQHLPLGVCVDGRCDYRYSGGIHNYSHQDFYGEWFDNCDEPSKCWTSKEDDVDEYFQQSVSREECLSQSSPCNDSFVHSIVWMQSRECNMNPTGIGTFCEGLPVRLFRCKVCNDVTPEQITTYKKDLCPTGSYVDTNGSPCQFMCANTKTISLVPNGAPCVDPTGVTTSTGNCYKGACYAPETDLKQLTAMDECLKLKQRYKEKWEYGHTINVKP